jgi:RecJ-like exonuclease
VKDVDGLSAAALTIAARGGTFRLTDYDQLFEELDNVPLGTDSLVLCDLGTDASKVPRFIQKLTELSSRMSVTYIDHHYLAPETRKSLEALPITLVHDTSECASMLTYITLKESLPQEAGYLALFGAVTDYMDSSPIASKMMERFDRQFVLLESTLMAYAVAYVGGEYEFLAGFVEDLSMMVKPHNIDGVVETAAEQAEIVTMLEHEVVSKGTQLGRLAYMETEQSSTGNVAKLLLGAFDVVAGVSFKRKDKEKAEMSIRGTSDCRVHLGQTISEIAGKHGGSGGGHQKAAGCSVPAADVLEVLQELASKV